MNQLDINELEDLVRQRMLQEGKTTEEIEAAVRELRAGQVGMPGLKGRQRYEYRSQASFLGLPLVHIVIGRDPVTGRVGKAVGVLAIARIAVGVVPIGQLAIGLFPIGQAAIGLIFALGQMAIAGYDAIGQLAVASHFALGQFAAAASAIGQLGVGKYVLAQAGWGEYVWSAKVQDPEALEHFREMFHWLFEVL